MRKNETGNGSVPGGGESGLSSVSLLALWACLLFLCSLSGCGITYCGVLQRRCIETERQVAVKDLIVAERNVVEACHVVLVKFKQPCIWPSPWPLTISFSEKKGEADTTLIKLPAELPGFLIP